MTEHRDTTKRRERGRARRRLVFVCTGLASLLALWGGCSIEKNYDLLSFLFDGVPDPNAPISGDGSRRGGGTGVVMYKHQPYAESACDACHRSSRRLMLTRVDPSVCVSCHAEVTTEYRFMHGPAVTNACLWCHEHHESPLDSLLKTRGADLCLQCHGLTFDTEPPIPEHVDRKRSCLDCHLGHGGHDPNFLRRDEVQPRVEPHEP